MKKYALCILLICTLLLSGCTGFSADSAGLISAPRLSKGQSEIYNALKEQAGGDIILKYPQSGDYTSAFILKDLDGDGLDEAVAFYAITSSKTDAIYLSVMDRVNGKWLNVYDAYIKSPEVYKVDFIGYAGKFYIAAAFSGGDGTSENFYLYAYKDRVLDCKYKASCYDFAVADLNGDEIKDLVTFSSETTENGGRRNRAVMYAVNERLPILGTAEISPEVVTNIAVNAGVLSDGTPALYIDEQTNYNVVTEVLVFDEGGLRNIVYKSEAENYTVLTERFAKSESYDLEGNGVYYTPTSLSISYKNGEQMSEEYLNAYIIEESFADWYSYDKQKGPVASGVVVYADFNYGYIFKLNELYTTTTAVNNSNENETIFCDTNALRGTGDVNGSAYLSIKIFRKSSYNEQAKNDGYIKISESGQLIYTYKFHNDGLEKEITSGDIIESFSFINKER